MSNNKFTGWTSVLNSVRTPLGFFALLALILDGILLGTAAVTAAVPMWAPLLLLGFLIACVFTIVLIKPHALYHPREWPAHEKTAMVNLLFPIEPIEVDLDVEQCIVEVRDKEGHRKYRGTPNLTFGHGGWTFQLMENVDSSDSVRLELMEHNGRKWRVNPFSPYETNQRALQIR